MISIITDRVTVSRAASLMGGGSQVYLKEGEVFTLEELMKAIMISSANDAVYAIGEYAGGSKDEMIRLMNEKAKVLGLLDTQFHTVHGLPQENGQKEDTTSCNDLAILARGLVRYPKIIEWSSIRTDTFRDGTFVMTNTNKFLSKFPGADGLKTGYCRNSGFNIVITAKRGDLGLIAVVMGSPTAQVRDAVAKERLQKAFSHYTMLNIVRKGEVIEQDILLVDGKYRKMKGVTEKGFLYPVANERKGAVAKDFFLPEKLEGEVREGQKLGEMVIRIDNETIGKVNIISPVYVPKANLLTRCVRRLGLNI